jgi:hypothetical protein
MEVKEELNLIKEAQQIVAGLDLEKKKVYGDILKEINPSPKLESILWDFIYNGVQCYKYDIEKILKNRKKWLDSGE